MSAYTEAVEHFLKGIGFISTGSYMNDCYECGDDFDPKCKEGGDGESWSYAEPYFSRSQCDGCGSRLGGSREVSHGIVEETGELIHLSLCTDCVVFINNGEEPEEWEG